MRRDPRDLQRYSAAERSNHWVVGICFILLGLSGLSLFHPLFFPLSALFGGGTWTRILHPFVGVLMAGAFVRMFVRFAALNVLEPADWQWLGRVREMAGGEDQNMPAQGKYNGGQKILFWLLAACMVLLLLSGLPMWRAYFTLSVGTVRLAAVVHAAMAAIMIGAILVHVYAAIWVSGTVRAMLYGTVTRAWARQHHREWYRQVTGK